MVSAIDTGESLSGIVIQASHKEWDLGQEYMHLSQIKWQFFSHQGQFQGKTQHQDILFS